MARAPLIVCLLIFVGLAAGCVTAVPVDDYTLARAAIEAAKDADSIRYAPGLWYKAEEAYKQGQKLFKDRRYDEAQKMFVQAKFMAEKAENAARLARAQSGEGVPP